jgi:hypothetical protein
MKNILVLFLFLITGLSNTAHAQCCAAGNPDSDDNLTEGGGKNRLLIALGYKYSYSDQYYLGTEHNDFDYVRYSDYDFSSLTFTYGITDKLKLTSDIGYFFSKAQVSDYRAEKNAYGLGDGSLTAVYNLYKTKKHSFSFVPIVKVTFPIGQFDQKDGIVVLPIDLQPSAGFYRYSGGLMVLKKFEGTKFSSNFLANMEASQRIDTERTNYKYGNLYNISLAGKYTLNKSVGFKLQSRYQIRNRASNANKELINATGGHVVFLSPQVSCTLFKTWRLGAIYDYPIYKNMNGRQLTNKYMVSVKLSKLLDFNKSTMDTCLVKTIPVGDFKETTLNIHGVCEACKDKIEEICYAQKGVEYANWVVETKMLTLKHTDKLIIEKLKKKLTKAGHHELE